ncbi:hypothetical protein ACQB60_40030 [Actinomycetota bacterium Odt1-20B]
MRATRRTFRTAAIATGAIAALAVPTTAAFASEAPAPHGQVATGDQTDRTDNNVKPGGDDNAKPDDNTKPDDHTKPDDQTKPDKDKDKPVVGGWESKGTTDLGGGWSAKVDVQPSTRSAKAEISLNKAIKGSLKATEGKSASTKIDGATFTLSADGTVTKTGGDVTPPKPGGWTSTMKDLGNGWSAKVDVNASARTAKAEIYQQKAVKGHLKAYIDDASTKIDGRTFTLTASGNLTMSGKPTPPKPTPERTFAREYKNLGGSGFDAKVYKVKGGYEADMIAKDPASGKKIVWDTIKQSGNKAAYGQHNGAHFVLYPDGTMKGWMDGKPAPKPNGNKNDHTVIPRGGVKAGADGVSNTSDDAPLLAAGGGLAAAGAAGLGFALYRRRQQNG